MSTLLVLTLCLAAQATPTTKRAVAPSAPTVATVVRAQRYDPFVWQIQNGAMYELELTTPVGSETFGLYVPSVPAAPQAPLLVHFHAYGGAHQELEQWSDFAREADARGWFLVAPDQDVRNASGVADGRTYNSEEAQRRVEAVIDWALANLPIDRDRIYGYGFSMGGGDCLGYAAQHLDPARGAFAAVCNHTGTLVTTEEWIRNAPAQPPLQVAFQGTPLEVAARALYRRASAVAYSVPGAGQGSFDPNGLNAFANLYGTPIWSWYYTGDTATSRAYEYMQVLDASMPLHQLQVLTAPPSYLPTNFPAGLHHAWEYLDEAAVCNWFAQQTLSVPTSGTLHFSQDKRYHDLWLTRKPNNADWGKVTFSLPPQSNTITFTGVSNVLRIRVDAALSSIDTQSGTVIINVGRDTHPSFVGRPVIIELENLGYTPTLVRQWNSLSAPTWTAQGSTFQVVSTAHGVTNDVLEIIR